MWTPTEVEATLTVLHDSEPVASWEDTLWVKKRSLEARPATTFDFTVPARLVGPRLGLEVRLRYASGERPPDPPSTEGEAVWKRRRLDMIDTDALTIVVITEGPHGSLAPDTSPEALARHRDRLFSLFPVNMTVSLSSVESPISTPSSSGTAAACTSATTSAREAMSRGAVVTSIEQQGDQEHAPCYPFRAECSGTSTTLPACPPRPSKP